MIQNWVGTALSIDGSLAYKAEGNLTPFRGHFGDNCWENFLVILEIIFQTNFLVTFGPTFRCNYGDNSPDVTFTAGLGMIFIAHLGVISATGLGMLFTAARGVTFTVALGMIFAAGLTVIVTSSRLGLVKPGKAFQKGIKPYEALSRINNVPYESLQSLIVEDILSNLSNLDSFWSLFGIIIKLT